MACSICRKDGHRKNNCPTEINKMIQIDLEQVFGSPQKLEECISNIHNARTVSSLKAVEEKIIYGIVCVDGNNLKDKMKEQNFIFSRDDIPEYFTSPEYVLYYHKSNVYYNLKDPSKFIARELLNYLNLNISLRKKGETDNMWKYISEICPMLIDNNYKRIIPSLCYNRKGKNHADAIISNDLSDDHSPCEHKFTDSGGVRQTFSKSFRKPTYVTALSNKEEVMRKLSKGSVATVNLDIYDVNNEKFFLIVENEINNKINRRENDSSKGTGRYEVTDMIKKIEADGADGAYNKKHSIHIDIGGDNE